MISTQNILDRSLVSFFAVCSSCLLVGQVVITYNLLSFRHESQFSVGFTQLAVRQRKGDGEQIGCCTIAYGTAAQVAINC